MVTRVIRLSGLKTRDLTVTEMLSLTLRHTWLLSAGEAFGNNPNSNRSRRWWPVLAAGVTLQLPWTATGMRTSPLRIQPLSRSCDSPALRSHLRWIWLSPRLTGELNQCGSPRHDLQISVPLSTSSEFRTKTAAVVPGNRHDYW